MKEKEELENFLIFLKIKNNFMTYFGKLVKENLDNTIFLNFFELTSKALVFEFYNHDAEAVKGNALLEAINY
jgi:hypothetical protein